MTYVLKTRSKTFVICTWFRYRIHKKSETNLKSDVRASILHKVTQVQVCKSLSERNSDGRPTVSYVLKGCNLRRTKLCAIFWLINTHNHYQVFTLHTI